MRIPYQGGYVGKEKTGSRALSGAKMNLRSQSRSGEKPSPARPESAEKEAEAYRMRWKEGEATRIHRVGMKKRKHTE